MDCNRFVMLLNGVISWLLPQKQLLGSPDDSDLGFLRSDNARKYIKQLPHFPKQPLIEKFPDLPPLAVDLAERMLLFDPSKRITGIVPTFASLTEHLFLLSYIFLIWNMFLVVFISRGGNASPLCSKSSWNQWRTNLPFSFQLRFRTGILGWRRYKRAYMEGISQVQSRLHVVSNTLLIFSLFGLVWRVDLVSNSKRV